MGGGDDGERRGRLIEGMAVEEEDEGMAAEEVMVEMMEVVTVELSPC